MDAGFYGLVEDGDTVRGKEHDALEVFELAEEDWKRLLALRYRVRWAEIALTGYEIVLHYLVFVSCL